MPLAIRSLQDDIPGEIGTLTIIVRRGPRLGNIEYRILILDFGFWTLDFFQEVKRLKGQEVSLFFTYLFL